MKYAKWILVIFVLAIMLTTTIPVLGVLEEGKEIISFGADLTRTQKDQMLNYFQPVGHPEVLEVTNSEEYYFLSKYISKEQIGSKAISSVYLQTLAIGAGVQVQTEKITWVTSGMYANAAVTAGVKDVLIKAGSPFPVSGTAALTGIFKAFEIAQGQPITSDRKETAYQELVTTGELGEEIGQEQAESLVRDVKEEIVKKKVSDPEEIRVIIENKAGEYNITLTKEQVQQIQSLMEKINRLGLTIDEMNNQLKSLHTRVKGIQEEETKARGILAQILNLLQQLLNLLAKIFGISPKST